jgi:hypothetical protein
VRIFETFLELFPEEWNALSARCTSDRDAVSAVLCGSVAAGIRELRPPDRDLVELIDVDDLLAADSFEALALCLDGADVWDDAEAREADRAIEAIPDWLDDDAYEARWSDVLAEAAGALATDWHRRRLARLVGRIERWLPFAGLPRAGAAVAEACAEFASEEGFRQRLLVATLEDVAGRDLFRQLRASLAA